MEQILITGGTGFIGKALLRLLEDHQYSLWVLTRYPGQHKSTDQTRYIGSLSEVQSVDFTAVINLAGESLAAGRWNEERKHRFVQSRVQMTQDLSEFLSTKSVKPQCVVNGSAIGFYGASGDEFLNEQSQGNDGFAHRLCDQWEQAARQLEEHCERLCILRIGVVLGHEGGPFAEMRQSFDMKVAAQIGNGEQWLSWIHRQDLVQAILFLIKQTQVTGVFNGTAPEPVKNKTFTQVLAHKMKSWIRLPMPAFAMRALVGEMADELLLTGQRVLPEALLDAGFEFAYPNLGSALDEILSHD